MRVLHSAHAIPKAMYGDAMPQKMMLCACSEIQINGRLVNVSMSIMGHNHFAHLHFALCVHCDIRCCCVRDDSCFAGDRRVLSVAGHVCAKHERCETEIKRPELHCPF